MATHTVRAGETLSAIAHRYRTTWQAIARLNALARPDRLVAGQRLKIPARLAGGHPGGPGAPAHGPSPAPSPHAPSPAPLPGEHPAGAPAPAAGAQAGGAQAGGAVTEAHLHAIMPHSVTRAATFVAPLNTAMGAYGIDTYEKRSAFLAQVSVESGDLQRTEENLNYTAERLHQVWPKRFASVAAAQPYAHNPEALANHVYANRLGNGDEASGDGYRYRGRGLIQTTGRVNYRAAGYEDRPDDLANPSAASDSAARFWSTNGLNPRSSSVLARGAFDSVTYTVNGGYTGKDERWAAYGRAVTTFGLTPAK